MEKIKETADKYKLNLISVPFNPLSLTVPIGDGHHEFFVLLHHHIYNK
jgi:hypothetical protein